MRREEESGCGHAVFLVLLFGIVGFFALYDDEIEASTHATPRAEFKCMKVHFEEYDDYRACVHFERKVIAEKYTREKEQ